MTDGRAPGCPATTSTPGAPPCRDSDPSARRREHGHRRGGRRLHITQNQGYAAVSDSPKGMSDSGSEMGAATVRQPRSDAVIRTTSSPAIWANTSRQGLCWPTHFVCKQGVRGSSPLSSTRRSSRFGEAYFHVSRWHSALSRGLVCLRGLSVSWWRLAGRILLSSGRLAPAAGGGARG